MKRDRKSESVVYAVVWVLICALLLLNAMRSRAEFSMPLIDAGVVWQILRSICPYVLLFLVNNYLLIPHLLLRNRVKIYLLCAFAAVMAVWVCEYVIFISYDDVIPPLRPHYTLNHHGIQPLMPLPLFLDFTYAILVIGANLATTLMFQRYYDRLEHENLMKTNAESQLAYLKAQINPHFYMNMLNNIHGLIEIDAERAQEMVIDMSNLMRYMLYESSQRVIPLANEVAFVQNYLRLMRRRYPVDKVSIQSSLPSEKDMSGVNIPPLFFLVFIENAFKHGVSYRQQSFVYVSVEVTANGEVVFQCENSFHPADPNRQQGIGLKNVSRRLELIYGGKASLNIAPTETIYSVTLTLPAYDTKNTDN